MDRTELLFGLTAFAALSPTPDREWAGLRGPVRIVSEGSSKTEYDPAGRLLSERWLANPNSESPDSVSLRTRTFDGSGRLLTDVVRIGVADPIEKVYVYNARGRLLRIEGSGDHTSFQYDERDRKTEIRDISTRSDDREGVATGIDVMFADSTGDLQLTYGGIRNASRIKTVYDDHDQPAETQSLDADGHILTRMIRTYDEQQRIVNIRTIVEDPISQFRGKDMADMIARSGVSLDEIRSQMKKVLGAMMGESGRTYTYDSQGRRTKIVLHQGALGDATRTYVYNDHGDVVEEQTTFWRNPGMPVGVPFQVDGSGNSVPSKPPSEWPPELEVPDQFAHYAYQYDSHGNWTERTVTHSLGWVYTRRREIIYH